MQKYAVLEQYQSDTLSGFRPTQRAPQSHGSSFWSYIQLPVGSSDAPAGWTLCGHQVLRHAPTAAQEFGLQMIKRTRHIACNLHCTTTTLYSSQGGIHDVIALGHSSYLFTCIHIRCLPPRSKLSMFLRGDPIETTHRCDKWNVVVGSARQIIGAKRLSGAT